MQYSVLLSGLLVVIWEEKFSCIRDVLHVLITLTILALGACQVGYVLQRYLMRLDVQTNCLSSGAIGYDGVWFNLQAMSKNSSTGACVSHMSFRVVLCCEHALQLAGQCILSFLLWIGNSSASAKNHSHTLTALMCSCFQLSCSHVL